MESNISLDVSQEQKQEQTQAQVLTKDALLDILSAATAKAGSRFIEYDCWIEISGNLAGDFVSAITITGAGKKGISSHWDCWDYISYNMKPYGWRIWTARPTEEQRMSTPWIERKW